MSLHLVNLLDPSTYSVDEDKVGYIMVSFWGEARWARPKYSGGFLPLSKEWLTKYWKYLGVYVEEIYDEVAPKSFLCWSGFCLNKGLSGYPDELRRFMEEYPQYFFLSTGAWTLSMSDKGQEFSVRHENGSEIKVDPSGIVLKLPAEGLVHLAGTGGQPIVLGEVLRDFLSSLVSTFNSHTHTNGNQGSPTGSPIVGLSSLPDILSEKVRTL